MLEQLGVFERARDRPNQLWRWETDEVGSFYVDVPHWFLAILLASIATAPWLRWRFSLRTLLIATTLVAVVLAIIVWMSRAG